MLEDSNDNDYDHRPGIKSELLTNTVLRKQYRTSQKYYWVPLNSFIENIEQFSQHGEIVQNQPKDENRWRLTNSAE